MAAAADGIRVVLTEVKFPSKLGLSGASTQRQERRRALDAFMSALVREGKEGDGGGGDLTFSVAKRSGLCSTHVCRSIHV